MAEEYNLKNVRALLTMGFTAEELRRFCYDEPDFRPVYEQLAPNTGKTEIIDRIIEYAELRLKLKGLLAWASGANPDRYERHGPYYEHEEEYDYEEDEDEEFAPAPDYWHDASSYIARVSAPRRLVQANIFQKLKALIVLTLAVDESEVTMRARWRDLYADDLDFMELIMAVESEFGVEVPDEESRGIGGVGELVEYLEWKLAQNEM